MGLGQLGEHEAQVGVGFECVGPPLSRGQALAVFNERVEPCAGVGTGLCCCSLAACLFQRSSRAVWRCPAGSLCSIVVCTALIFHRGGRLPIADRQSSMRSIIHRSPSFPCASFHHRCSVSITLCHFQWPIAFSLYPSVQCSTTSRAAFRFGTTSDPSRSRRNHSGSTGGPFANRVANSSA